MIDVTLVLKKHETGTGPRERRDIVSAYRSDSQGDPSKAKFDILKVRNVPAPHASFFRDVAKHDWELTGSADPKDPDTPGQFLRNKRRCAVEDELLPPPVRNALDADGIATVTWGAARNALRVKQDRIETSDDETTRRGKSRPMVDDDVTTGGRLRMGARSRRALALGE